MKALFGGILLAIGILIAGASGLCSLAMLTVGGFEGLDMAGVVLIVGGIPFIFGLGLAFLGRSLIRAARIEAETRPPEP